MDTKKIIDNCVNSYQQLKETFVVMEALRKAAIDEDVPPLLEYMAEKNKEIEELKDKVNKFKELEKENNDLRNEIEKQKKEVGASSSDISEKLNKIKRDMTVDFYLLWRRKRSSTTELYYNWLLKDAENIDGVIPGFASSWKAYRRDFKGLFGLVRAAEKVLTEKSQSAKK